ncbi:MAG: TonB-dependent receptor, partial [Acidobacteriia bacterium]|nr:TonB-dependent receptor [Terriglobia bacterium]
GAIVPEARITIRNEDTDAEREVLTNSAGIYVAAFLQPGHYEVSVAKPGFGTAVRKGLTLQVGQVLTIDLVLSLAATKEEVAVTAETPVLDVEKTEVSQVVSENMVDNLPLVGRRWDNFVLLTPGVTTDGNSVSFRGISSLYNNNSVDSANNNQAFFSTPRGGSTAPYVYSLDSIQEFQVSPSNYGAEFGQAAGGIVNAITRSGSNAVHGDLFYYLRYPSLNALDPVAKAGGIDTQPVHQQQQFGSSLGGPIWKDKLFYFFTYDGSRKVFPISFTSTAAFPLPCPPQVAAGQCAAANSYLQSLTGSYPREAVQDLAFGKLDYQLNQTNRLSASFDFDDFHSPDSFLQASLVNNSVTANGPAVTHARFLVTNWESVIRPNLVNSLRFQWGVDNEIQGVNSGGPGVTVSGVMAYGPPPPLPRPSFPDEHRWQFADTLSLVKGRHALKFGADVNLIHDVLVNLFQGEGVYSYSGAPAAAFGNWVADVYGVNLGDGLTGRHYTSFTQAYDPITKVGKDDFWDRDYAGFAEDRWRARPNLTLNFGLRYEIQTIPSSPHPNTTIPLLTALTSKINTDSNNFGPRIGIAWQPLTDTVIRAGYGIFYGKTSNSTYYALRVENGIYQQQFNCPPKSSCAPTFPNVIFTPPGPPLAAPFPGALAPEVVNTNPPLGVLATHGVANDFVNPLVHEGEVTIERRLPGNLSLSAGWVFSRALHLPVFVDANLAPPTITEAYAILNASGALTQLITEPFYTQRIDPRTGIIATGYSVVNAWYNGLLVTLRRPLGHGIEFLANYTFSKSIDDGAVQGNFGTFSGTDVILNPQNIKQENGLSELDQRHRFTGAVVWDPFRNLQNNPGRWLLKGFVFSTIVTEASGQPVQANVSGFPSNGVDGGVTGGEINNSAAPAAGRAPQIGRNVFVGPALHNVDFRVMRAFPLRERLRVEFLSEAFNLFNETNLNLSGNTATTAYNYVAVGGKGCPASAYASTNGCLLPSPTFMAPSSGTSTNTLYGPRQLQFSAKLVF